MVMVKNGKEVRMMVDPAGFAIPRNRVSKYDRLRDREVRRLTKAFAAERLRMEGLMGKVLESIERVKAERGTGVAERGNIQFSSFDNLMRVEVVTRYKIELDDRALDAKRMMVDYVTKGLDDVKDAQHRQAVLALITDTFTPTRGGCLRANMVVRLLNYKIMAKEWQSACAVLREAMETYRSKSYVNVSTRESHQDDWSTIRLDLADCWPAGFVVS